MTRPIGWITCTKCGVTQPDVALTTTKGSPEWFCIDTARCATWKAKLDAERADFAKRFPELVVVH